MTVEELADSQRKRWAKAARQLRRLLDGVEVDTIVKADLYKTIREARDEVGKICEPRPEPKTEDEIREFWEIAREW